MDKTAGHIPKSSGGQSKAKEIMPIFKPDSRFFLALMVKMGKKAMSLQVIVATAATK